MTLSSTDNTNNPSNTNNTSNSSNSNNRLRYVLITPARNEARIIGNTIQSVASQTFLPIKWVIVSDGSTDRTDEIVKEFLPGNPWIEFIRMPEHGDRHFAAKVQSFNAGFELVKDLDFDIIGNLDADVTFEPDYLEYLISQFESKKELGVAGTPFIEDGIQYDYRFTNIEHVSGQCQLFRRECFEEIGGYMPIKGGGIDWTAVTTARMKGWETRTFTGKVFLHHRKMGTGNASAIMANFKQGIKDYSLGNHPLWEIFRVVYQMTKPPFIIRGALILFGFISASLKRLERPISKELMDFVRMEQMGRLKAMFRKLRIG